MSIEKQHFYNIDTLRGIASLMVAFFHFTNGNPNFLPEKDIFKAICSIGWTGVQVFFVISGFVIPFAMYRANYSYKSLHRFLGRRIIRIDPPYLLSILIVIILGFVSAAMPFYRGEPYLVNFKDIFLHFAYLNAFFDSPWLNPVYWTLAIEFQYYIIIAIIFPLIIHPNKLVQWSTLLTFALLKIVLPSGNLIFHHAPLFILGITLFKIKIGFISQKEFWITAIIIMSSIIFIFSPEIIGATIFAFLFVHFVKNSSRVGKFLGNISYSLYLIHVPIGMRIINISDQFISSIWLKYIIIFFTAFVCISFSWLYYIYIEKPSLKLSKKILYHKKS